MFGMAKLEKVMQKDGAQKDSAEGSVMGS